MLIPLLVTFAPLSAAIVRAEFVSHRPPTRSCHASTLAETTSGGLVAAWFGGTAESNPDVGIYLSRFERGRWSPPVEVADGRENGLLKYACYNPVLFQPRNGPLLLFYKVGLGPSTWRGMMKRSSDGGRTWGPAERLPAGILGPIKNRPIELGNDELLCPSSSEENGWRVHMERTSDFGLSWISSPALNDGITIGAIQPSLLQLKGNSIRAIGRTRQSKLFVVDSSDSGENWGPMRLIDVDNPNSGTDAITLRDHRFLLVYNPSPLYRSPLCVAISIDAETWTNVLTLEDEPGEFSYPTAIQTSDGLVHITYTWKRARIRHVVLNPDKLGI